MFVVLSLKVVPQSGRSALVWDERAGLLKVFLKSAPEKNNANNELVTLLRKTLGVPAQSVCIVGGATARHKRVRIQTALSYDEVLALLGVPGQQQCLW